MKFFTSDLHLEHANVIKFCNRPTTLEGMTDWIVDNWNSVVKKGDIVYHLGDLTFRGSDYFHDLVDILERLNGDIVLIPGNHDKEQLQKRLVAHYKGNQKLTVAPPILETKVQGVRVVLCHYSMRTWNQSHRGSIQLFGHSHGSLEVAGKSMDVGIDANPFHRPFSEDEVIELMSKKEIYIPEARRKALVENGPVF